MAGGGAQQMILQLAKKSNPEFRTIVFSISSVNTIEEKFKENGIEYHFLNINSFKNPTLIDGLRKLHSVLKDIPDAVFHCHQFHGNFLAVLYKIFYQGKIRFAYTMHTNKVESVVRRIFLFITKPLRSADIIFSHNSNKWYLKNTAVIPNGVDFSSFTANTKRNHKKSDTFSFLYLGRLSSEKNPFQLIDAAQYLVQNNVNDFIIEYVGDGGLREELEKEIDTKQLGKFFKFHGFQSHIQPFIQNSHCLVLPSFREGMPVVIIEAAAALLPVIATPVGSIPDFMNEANGYLCEPQEFGKTMMHVLRSYEEALVKANELNSDVKTIFDIDKVYLQHLSLYRSYLALNHNE